MTKAKSKATVDTIVFTPQEARSWLLPPFQRPLRVNAKVTTLAETIKAEGGVLPGMLTFGVLGKKRYLIDGQHRREAFLMSGLGEGMADIRIHDFETMADMGREFVNLNSRLVTLRPDDILRGIEDSLPMLGKIRVECPYVGYDMVRRGDKTPILSLSALLRCWHASASDIPASSKPALDIAQNLTEDDTTELLRFLKQAYSAWGRDPEYYRLWSALNMTICMWLYRRIVSGPGKVSLLHSNSRSEPITLEQFKQCLMSLSADVDYNSWLVGRNLSDRDRSPCLNRIKNIFSARLRPDKGRAWKMPAPAWAPDGGHRSR